MEAVRFFWLTAQRMSLGGKNDVALSQRNNAQQKHAAFYIPPTTTVAPTDSVAFRLIACVIGNKSSTHATSSW